MHTRCLTTVDRYNGHVPDDADISITEIEYNRAVELDKARLIFLIHDHHPVTGKDIEKGVGAVKLEALKERLKKDRVAAFFKSAGDLRGHVIEALLAWRKQSEIARSNTRARRFEVHRHTSIPATPMPYVAHPYTLMHVRDLVGRGAELNLMTDWIVNSKSEAFGSRIFCFVAIRGMGKSALTWKWFHQIAPEEMKPLAGRIWWSFYESDASFEKFLKRTLAYVSGQSEDDIRALSWSELEANLLGHLSERPFLLVFDGLERILLAYHRMDASYVTDDQYDEQTANRVADAAGLPSSAAQSFYGRHLLRHAIDPRVGTFLRRLAQAKLSRIVINTRLYPSELQISTGRPRPGCFHYFLPGLSDDDALELWRALGVSGSRSDLTPIFRSVKATRY